MTTRRNFLKTSSFASLGLLGAAVSTARAADVASSTLPSKWDGETDVLVAGSGIAGMSAAISAMDKGAKVLVLEKGKNYGGCAIINGGIIALGGGTRTQKEHGVEDSPELLYKKLTNPAHHEYRKNTPELVKKYSEWCPGTQVWLE
ncbi:FAD-dependent oxidoreductase, partial [Turicimonas muris]